MSLLVDTSVWSLALRRDGASESREVIALREAFDGADSVVTTNETVTDTISAITTKVAAIPTHAITAAHFTGPTILRVSTNPV